MCSCMKICEVTQASFSLFCRVTSSNSWLWLTPKQQMTTVNTTAPTVKLPTVLLCRPSSQRKRSANQGGWGRFNKETNPGPWLISFFYQEILKSFNLLTYVLLIVRIHCLLTFFDVQRRYSCQDLFANDKSVCPHYESQFGGRCLSDLLIYLFKRGLMLVLS